MAHLFRKDVASPKTEEKFRTDYNGDWDFQISVNSDGRLCLRFYKKEDGDLLEEAYVNLDRPETQKLYKFLNRKVTL